MKWSQKILLAGYVLALAGMLTLPATAQQVTIALGSEPTTLDPQLREDGGERAVNDNIYETLMARDPNGNLVPEHPGLWILKRGKLSFDRGSSSTMANP